jgi:hypothetical protein
MIKRATRDAQDGHADAEACHGLITDITPSIRGERAARWKK